MVDIQSATAEIRRRKKEVRKKNKRQDENIYGLPYGGHKNGDAQKKRSGREVRGVSPEAGRESMVGKICQNGRLMMIV